VDFAAQAAKVLYYPLVTLSGTPVTLAAILIALFIFLAFRSIAQVIGFAIREGLKRHGQADGVAAAIAQITRYVLVGGFARRYRPWSTKRHVELRLGAHRAGRTTSKEGRRDPSG
jgi:hypothetical protein